jgi:signal transduction histidine kinase
MIQLALFLGALATLLLGFFVLLNNPRSTQFRLYFIFSTTSFAWILVNALTTSGPLRLEDGTLLLLSRLITPFSLMASLSFVYFIKFFKDGKLQKIDFLPVIPSLVVGLFSFTSLNVFLQDGRPTLGGLYPAYVSVIIFNVSLMLFALYKKSAQGTRKRLQMTYLKIGALCTLVPVVGFGAVLPLFSDSNLTDLGPLFFLVFLVFAGIAIARHRLFDLRFAVARSLAYAFAIGIVVMGYVVVAFGLMNLVFGTRLDVRSQIFLAFFGALLALSFQSVKKFFDRVTNKFFYRDAYDPQALFDTLNRTLVSTADLDAMLQMTSTIIAGSLKPSACSVVLRSSATKKPRIVGSTPGTFDERDISAVQTKRLMAKSQDTVIVAAYLDEGDRELRRILDKNGVALIVGLGIDSQSGAKEFGHLILGSKRSGNPYNSQDIRVMETIANELVLAIQNALRFEEIENFNLTLQEKIEDATKKLRSTNDKLRKLDETKDDFISMASHQLRTPLTSIKGYTSMVLDGDAGKISPLQRKLLNQAFISSQRMVYLISDLLNVSRLRTGKFIIEPVPTNLAHITKDEVDQLIETAKGRNLNLVYHRPEHFPTYLLDETKLRQVIMNFIDNAIYYTPSGGNITINLVEKPQSIEFTVTDDGIGVPKADQHHLFSKFYRAHNAKRARPDGTGLGLFMAKKVVIAQGGSTIFSSRPGKGSTFGFNFAKAHLNEPTAKTKNT